MPLKTKEQTRHQIMTPDIGGSRKGALVLISHGSAIAFWDSRRLSSNECKPVLATKELCDSMDYVNAGDVATRFGLKTPLSVSVLSGRNAGSRLACRLHEDPSLSRIPCAVRLEKDVAVCIPELAFMQVATSMTRIQQLQLGYRLCGRYDTLSPIMNLDVLGRLLDQRPNKAGSKQTRFVHRYLVQGAMSEAESILVMLLTLPYEMGGFGLPKPQLSSEVKLSKYQQRILHRESIRPDLVWHKQKVALEYDSKQFHAGYDAREYDAKRINAFQDAGYRCLSITKSQIEDIDCFEGQVRALAGFLGKKIDAADKPCYQEARYRLRAELAPDWLGRCDLTTWDYVRFEEPC